MNQIKPVNMKNVDLDNARRISLLDAMRLGRDALLVDLRNSADYYLENHPESLRFTLRDVVSHARSVPEHVPVIYYCDCGRQETSARAVLLVEKYAGRAAAAFAGSTEDWNTLLRHVAQPLAEVN